jgi:pimeloyl-ACP methyl ester carboxylesterase
MATSPSRPPTAVTTKAGPRPPQASGRLLSGSHRLAYELHGPPGGRGIVLLHHGLGSMRAWKSQISAFADAGYRVLVYDRWGYGASDSRPALDLPTFEADQIDLARLLDEVGLERACLIGHSDGGTMALYFTARRPERVWALITVAAHIYVEPSKAPSIFDIGEAYATDAEMRKKLERAHGPMADRVFHNWYDGWAQPRHLNWDMRPIVRGISCPALVIQGEDDEHASPQHARDLAECLERGSLWLIPGVRHMAPQEIPEEFNRRSLEFLGASV